MKIDKKEIVACFFKVLKPDQTPPSKKKALKILKEADKYLRKGWTVTQITNRIVSIDKKNNVNNFEIKKLSDIKFLKGKPPFKKRNNLLENKFYYHHLLRNISDPKEISIDIDGTLNIKSKPNYLEMKEYFSIKNLIDYFHKKMNIKDKAKYKINKKISKRLIANYSLDLILFTIDSTYHTLKDKDYRMYDNIKRIINHIQDGIERFQHMKNNSNHKLKPYYKAYLKQKKGRGRLNVDGK
jgi:hypothetical protein